MSHATRASIQRRLLALERADGEGNYPTAVFVSFVEARDGRPASDDETDCTGVRAGEVLVQREPGETLAELDRRALASLPGGRKGGGCIWMRQYCID